MEWIARTERMPDSARPVLVMMDAGAVGNPSHPGFATGGKWVEISRRGEALNGAAMLDVFVTEFCQTGMVTHWAELPALPEGQAAAAQTRPQLRVRAFYNPELEALRNFHEFFLDQCEALFFACGWPAINLFNEAAAARRGELAKPNSVLSGKNAG